MVLSIGNLWLVGGKIGMLSRGRFEGMSEGRGYLDSIVVSIMGICPYEYSFLVRSCRANGAVRTKASRISTDPRHLSPVVNIALKLNLA